MTFRTHFNGLRFLVTADGPGHAASQVLSLTRDLGRASVRRQVEIDADTMVLGQEARDLYREDGGVSATPFKMKNGGNP